MAAYSPSSPSCVHTRSFQSSYLGGACPYYPWNFIPYQHHLWRRIHGTRAAIPPGPTSMPSTNSTPPFPVLRERAAPATWTTTTRRKSIPTRFPLPVTTASARTSTARRSIPNGGDFTTDFQANLQCYDQLKVNGDRERDRRQDAPRRKQRQPVLASDLWHETSRPSALGRS